MSSQYSHHKKKLKILNRLSKSELLFVNLSKEFNVRISSKKWNRAAGKTGARERTGLSLLYWKKINFYLILKEIERIKRNLHSSRQTFLKYSNSACDFWIFKPNPRARRNKNFLCGKNLSQMFEWFGSNLDVGDALRMWPWSEPPHLCKWCEISFVYHSVASMSQKK